MKAVILAAGFGKRLRPLTDYLPKVLVPVLGVPAIDHVVERLLLQGVQKIGVNVHYRAGQIRSHLESAFLEGKGKGRGEVCIAHEEEILGTGGAIYNFRDFLRGDEPFWVYNGDIVSDIDLPSALHFHRTKKPLATLILWDYPPINTVSMDSKGNILSLFSRPASCADSLPSAGSVGQSTLTFTGISILSPRILDYMPEGYSEIPGIYQSIIAAKGQGAGKICGFRGRGRYWADFGTVSSYLDVHRDLLLDRPQSAIKGAGICSPEAGRRSIGCVYRSGKRGTIARSAQLGGFVSMADGCVIEDDVFLEDCVLWPGTRVLAGTRAQRAVLSQDFLCREKEKDGRREPMS
ncbi:MAG: NDP-sugar synthase [bacterium]